MGVIRPPAEVVRGRGVTMNFRDTVTRQMDMPYWNLDPVFCFA